MVYVDSESGGVTYRILPHLNVFVAIVRGDIRFQDLHQHVQELMDDKDFLVGINGIYDFTRVTSLTGQIQKFEDLADEMSDQDIISKPSKTAIVIDQQQRSVKAMMEGYLLMTSSSNVDYHIFHQDQWPLALKHVDLSEDFNLKQHGL